ncbi:MAG: hypothetical protein R2780_06215 [Crocinitomicaceae bacterium]|nr:hypothetical protein [Crocinitomicaceae bacterium]
MILRIRNIPKDTTKPQLRALFRPYGRISAIIKRGNTAFIHMTSRRRAQAALDDLNETTWNGNHISVSSADSNTELSICRTEHGIMRMF